MSLRVTPSGSVRPFHCHVCSEDVDGAGAEYVNADVVDDKTGRIVYTPREAVRRHFLNATHAVTHYTIDYRPTPLVLAFGR